MIRKRINIFFEMREQINHPMNNLLLDFFSTNIRGGRRLGWNHALPSKIVDELRTLAPIATAHLYSARKFTCHIMHRARALSTKKWTMIGKMAIFITLLQFNDLGCSVTPTFLFRNRFYLQLSPHYPKINRKSMWEVKRISSFLSSGRKILPSCGCKAQETMVAKCELVL